VSATDLRRRDLGNQASVDENPLSTNGFRAVFLSEVAARFARMAVGQAVLAPAVLDVAAVRRIEERVEDRERSRAVQHAEQLTDLLALERVYDDAGMALGATAEIALLLRCSEHRAGALLDDARVLQRLGALAVMRTGLLTIEQSRVVVEVLGRLDDVALAASLWERLHLRLLADADQGVLLPPARLRELLQRWLLTADPDGAVARRKSAQRESQDVEVWKRDDGLLDIALRGVTGPNAQSCLSRISEHADPVGPYDERTEGQRRVAAAVDLLTGRIALPFGCQPGCGCGLGAEVPCGAQVFVHVPLPTTLGASDDPAELVGHGPLDPDLLQQLLLSAPTLHRVWVDPETGVPVAVDDRTWQPGRRDPHALRAALLDIGSGPPPPPDRRHPIHPDDHPPPDRPDSRTARRCPTVRPARVDGPRILTRPHLTDPGPYTPGRRLKRLVRARAPRCEWPACGRRATRCDLDHDLPWPYGATCACNLGPLCRRHHRIKQLGWTKHRRPDGSIRWTSPTGRTWTTPAPHPKVRASRDVPPLHVDPRDALTQAELDRLMTELGPAGAATEATPQEEPAPEDPLRTTADLWTLLHDPSTWQDWPEPLEP
jgi:hypothetical protein